MNRFRRTVRPTQMWTHFGAVLPNAPVLTAAEQELAKRQFDNALRQAYERLRSLQRTYVLPATWPPTTPPGGPALTPPANLAPWGFVSNPNGTTLYQKSLEQAATTADLYTPLAVIPHGTRVELAPGPNPTFIASENWPPFYQVYIQIPSDTVFPLPVRQVFAQDISRPQVY